MPLGIKPTVDFAFKRAFGTPDNRRALRGSGWMLEQWAFFLRHAEHYDGEDIRRLLPGPEFEPAIGALKTIAAKTEDKAMYDQREKAQRDCEWMLAGAHEEGLEKGLEKGLDLGIEKGRQEGWLSLLAPIGLLRPLGAKW